MHEVELIIIDFIFPQVDLTCASSNIAEENDLWSSDQDPLLEHTIPRLTHRGNILDLLVPNQKPINGITNFSKDFTFY